MNYSRKVPTKLIGQQSSALSRHDVLEKAQYERMHAEIHAGLLQTGTQAAIEKAVRTKMLCAQHNCTEEKYQLSHAHYAQGGKISSSQQRSLDDERNFVQEALMDTVTDIGQIPPSEKKRLEQAVKKGILSKGKGGGFPKLKTVYAIKGFDFAKDRKQQVAGMMKLAKMDADPASAQSKVYKKKTVQYSRKIK